MMARRLDLGADVVAIPSRGIVAIHPELDYSQALGAVMATLPDLHPDAAVALVDQVTPRPRPDAPRAVPRLLAAAVALAAMLVLNLGSQDAATAGEARFGNQWAQQMSALGLRCEDRIDGDNAQTCIDRKRHVYKVQGFVRKNADLYVLDREGWITSIMVFRTPEAAEKYRARHPHIEMAGTVAVWTRRPTTHA